MTTFIKAETTCAVCGETSTFAVLSSTSQFGEPDLDTRPPEMVRSTLSFQIQCCPACHYCSPDISEAHPGASQIIRSAAYREQRNDNTYPDLANKFLCRAIIEDQADSPAGGGWAALRAAWVCDDAGETESARRCRQRAIGLFEKARQNGEIFAEDAATEAAILADLWRRSGEFDKAKAVCGEGLNKEPAEIVRKILYRQQALAEQQDDGCYTIEGL